MSMTWATAALRLALGMYSTLGPTCMVQNFQAKYMCWMLSGPSEKCFSLHLWRRPPCWSLATAATAQFRWASGDASAKLTPLEVTEKLRQNEYTSDPEGSKLRSANRSKSDPVGSSQRQVMMPSVGPVKYYDLNFLASNTPIEDSHAEAKINVGPEGKGGYLFGIYDGHGGASCGQVVAKRLFNYVSAALLSPEDLFLHVKAFRDGLRDDPYHTIIAPLNENFELVADLKEIYDKSYAKYIQNLLSKAESNSNAYNEVAISERLSAAFVALDDDLSAEALPGPDINMKTLSIALSGAVSVVGYVDGPELHVASTGDCAAVLGTLSENDTWIAQKLTTAHCSSNANEIARILAEHPGEKERDIIRGDRLLGMLAPFRAFGDFRFKWPRETIKDTLASVLGGGAISQNYKTPPYLTAAPEVSSVSLTPRDKFLVIGSDGLWDMMTPMQVIRLVGEHKSGKVTISPLDLEGEDLSLDYISQILKQRHAALKLKPIDANSATHLIRNALGGSAYGVDHDRLSQMLTLPQDMVRMFRDDITVIIVHFDSEYIGTC